MRLLLFLTLITTTVSANDCEMRTSCLECDTVPKGMEEPDCNWCESSKKCVSISVFKCMFGDKIRNRNDCPMESRKGFEFNETFARMRMFPYSAAAYSDTPQKCLDNVLGGAQLKRQVFSRSDILKKDKFSGFVAVSHPDKAIVLSFRGTTASMQLFMEVADTIIKKKSTLKGGAKVNYYFFSAFQDVWTAGMEQTYMTLKQKHPNYELWLTGHSLGGSMASIAAYIIGSEGLHNVEMIRVVTFGEPRTGDEQFVNLHDSLLPYSYRITHAEDMVPHVPPKGMEGYVHHRQEIWYNNDMEPGMEYKICTIPDSPHCSNSKTALSIDDHLHYYGIMVSYYGISGCTQRE